METTFPSRCERPNQSPARGRKAPGQAMVRISRAMLSGRNWGSFPQYPKSRQMRTMAIPVSLACSGVELSHRERNLPR